jgi:hypothetical protein
MCNLSGSSLGIPCSLKKVREKEKELWTEAGCGARHYIQSRTGERKKVKQGVGALRGYRYSMRQCNKVLSIGHQEGRVT